MAEWWRGAVIYQVYPRSFQDTNGDGVGDLAGIIDRIEHIASLGVDAIWLSPITQSPQKDMGYDVSDYKDVDPLFGSLNDFDSLIERAHALGLKVIIDQVISHSSDQHPWFRESKLSRTNGRADWYVWADPRPDGTPPNNWPSVFGGRAWDWNPTRGQYFFHNFLAEQPDLNFHNPVVQDAMLDVLRFWLERGVDGFRLDTVNYYFHDKQLRNNPPKKRKKGLPYAVNPYDMQEHIYGKSRPENIGFLKRLRSLVDEFEDRTTVGEVGDSDHGLELMAEYTSGGDKLHMAYTFDMLGNEFTAAHFRSKLQSFLDKAPGGWPCWAFSNHDVDRHVTRWIGFSRDRVELAQLAASMLLSFPGSVCLYQGEELGLPQTELRFEELTDPPGIRMWPEYKGRDGCRTPIPWEAGDPPNGFTTGKPWLPVKPPQAALNVAAQEADPGSTLHFYRRAIAFRKAHDVFAGNRIEFFKVAEPLLAFRRLGEVENLVCLSNLSAEPLSITLDGEPDAQPLGTSQRAERVGKRLTLGPNGFAFFAEPSGPGTMTVKYGGRRKA